MINVTRGPKNQSVHKREDFKGHISALSAQKNHYTMISFRLISAFFLAIIFISLSHAEEAKNPFFDDNGLATNALVELLGETGIQIKDDVRKENWPQPLLMLKTRQINEIDEALQGKTNPKVAWHQGKTQRWHMRPKVPLGDQKAKEIIQLCFEKFDLATARYPKEKQYKGVLFLGSLLSSVRQRLAFLNELVEKNAITFDKVYVLTGERKLEPGCGETAAKLLKGDPHIIELKSSWQTPKKLPANETEMVKLVFDQSAHPLLTPERVKFVHSLKEKGHSRATTKSTTEQWIQEYQPENGTYLAISNQPFALYQELVIKRNMLANKKDIQIEAVGPGISPETIANYNMEHPTNKAAVLLDNIAKIIHELKEIWCAENAMQTW